VSKLAAKIFRILPHLLCLTHYIAGDPALRRTAAHAAEARKSLGTRIDELLEGLNGIQTKMQGEHQTWAPTWAPTFKAGKKSYEEAVQHEGGDYKILAQECRTHCESQAQYSDTS
jgi:hypothetical protein